MKIQKSCKTLTDDASIQPRQNGELSKGFVIKLQFISSYGCDQHFSKDSLDLEIMITSNVDFFFPQFITLI